MWNCGLPVHGQRSAAELVLVAAEQSHGRRRERCCSQSNPLARRTGRCLAPPCRRGEREVELPVGTGQTSEPVVVNKLGDVDLAVGCVVGDAVGAEVKMAFTGVLFDSFFAVEEEGGAAIAVTGVTNVAIEINVGNGIV